MVSSKLKNNNWSQHKKIVWVKFINFQQFLLCDFLFNKQFLSSISVQFKGQLLSIQWNKVRVKNIALYIDGCRGKCN